MNEHPISELVTSAMQNIREMVDVNTIIGNPIETSDGVTIIPISRVSFGFGAGGSEFAPKNEKPDSLFGGGSGAGVSITPVGFLVVSAGDVKMVPVASDASAVAVDKIMQTVPLAVDKVTEYFKKRKEKKASEAQI